MRAKAIGPLLGAVAVAALLIPGAAGAKPSAQRPASRGGSARPEVTEHFKVKGTNGFTLDIELFDRRSLSVTAHASAGGKLGNQEVLYSLPAPQSPGSDDIKARIGSLGKIDVRFVPGSTKKRVPKLPGCTGGETVTETGHFVGQVSFHGEQGYTDVSLSRAAGTVVSETPPKCKGGKSLGQELAALEKELEGIEGELGVKSLEQVQLNAISGHGRINFEATRTQGKVKGTEQTFAGFTAAAARNRGKISEVSLVLLLDAKAASFLSPEPLFPTREATISPPAPFSGTGTFTREPGKTASWSGDLAVELPGFGNVPLAGSGSKASMCQAPACGGL
jgi:hypothetical protein